jgi:short-subunit dehydrogenase
MKFFLGLFAVILIPIAIFLSGDADIGLLFSPSPPNMSYLNQVIWITGASSGIGAATALEFTKLGAQVIISARRADKLYTLSNSSQGQGTHEMFVLPLDLMDFESHEKAYQTILAKFGHVDILVLNAGQSQRNAALDTPFEDTRSLMELNFFSCVHLAKVVVPGMITHGGGKVKFHYSLHFPLPLILTVVLQLVLMSSLSGKLGTPIGSSYSASKFALVCVQHLTELIFLLSMDTLMP